MSSSMSSSPFPGELVAFFVWSSLLFRPELRVLGTLFDERNGLFEVFDTCLTSSLWPVAPAANAALPGELLADAAALAEPPSLSC